MFSLFTFENTYCFKTAIKEKGAPLFLESGSSTAPQKP